MQAISGDEMIRAQARFARRLAAVLLNAMAERDVGFHEIDKPLGGPPGWSKGRLHRLVAGKLIKLDELSDILFAMGLDLDWTVRLSAAEENTP